MTDDPVERFLEWFQEAEQAGNEVPEAMTLATATADGAPSARMVLLKGADDGGFVFYSGYVSRKARARAESACGPGLLLAGARQADPGRRAGRAGLDCRIGGVLRDQAAGESARGMGLAAKPFASKP